MAPTASLQMLGDDWAPEGFERWRNAAGTWEVHPEAAPGWSWTAGFDHLVECIERGVPPVMRPEHSLHALEVMLAAGRSAKEGRAIDLESAFRRPTTPRSRPRPAATGGCTTLAASSEPACDRVAVVAEIVLEGAREGLPRRHEGGL